MRNIFKILVLAMAMVSSVAFAGTNGAYDSARRTVNAVTGVNFKSILSSSGAGLGTIQAMLTSAAGKTFNIDVSGVPDGSNDCNCAGRFWFTAAVAADGQSVLLNSKYCEQYGCVNMPAQTLTAMTPRVTLMFGFYGAGNGDERAYASFALTASGMNFTGYVEDYGYRGQWICAVANTDDIAAGRNLRNTRCEVSATGWGGYGSAGGVHNGFWWSTDFF